ncbi:AsmA family protein [Brevundimonas sp.]|uniref:AsmA family protein n=1 Tax=Brevundimonas sp. TaxID=1871086 RepID=UPI002737AE99|nr:AsmA family protein [Brevundimonas sp.]
MKENPNWLVVRDRALVPAGAWARSRRDWIVTRDPVYAGLRRPGRTEQIAAGATVALLALMVVLLMLFQWNWLRGPIGDWASARYDREIELNGDLDVNLFSGTPSARIRGLRIGGPDWAAERDTLRVEDIQASVKILPLLSGRIEMPALTITRPEAVLIATEDGRKSWKLDPDAPDTGEGLKLPPIHRLTIRDGRLSLTEQRRDMTLEATITAREGTDGEAGFHLDGRGTMNGTPLTLTVRGGPFINIRRDRPYAFTAELAGVGSRLKADGSITRPFDLGQFQAALSLQGRDMADLYLLTGVTTPNTPPYRLSGALTRDDALFTFSDFSGRVGSSDLSGDLTVNKVGDRRRVEADLRSRLLDIEDLMAVLGAEPRVTPSGDTVVTSGAPGRLLPDAPLNVERLRVMDGTLRYRAARVKRNDLDIRQVDLGAELKDGILNLDPVAFNFNRGELRGTARINATRDMPYTTADFRLRGYPLESIIPARDGVPTVTGRALGRAKLEGPGASVHDFAAGSKGAISLVVPQGQMRAAFAELLGINLTAGLGKLLSGDTGSSEIRCAVADFTVSGGTATARTFVIDTTPVLARGSGTIDLGAETMNLRIDGETKQARLIRLWSPIVVQGPLTGPKVGVDSASVAGQVGLGAALGALINPLVALLPFVDPGLAEDANCGALISSAR